MKHLHSFFVSFICILCMLDSVPVYAEEQYHVMDINSGFDESFSSYSRAYGFYQENLDQYGNLILMDGDRVIHMEYGFVEFITDEACSLGIEYYSESKGSDDYLNGCYGADAAYLKTGSDGKRVYFLLSEDMGSVELDKVILHPYDPEESISFYSVLNGQLVHNIRTRFDQDHYSYSIVLDDALPFMKEGDTYYSCDGHFFYDDYLKMIDDIRNETQENALNEEPYYNYYQFLPYRSLSSYSAAELEYYLNIVLGIRSHLTHYIDKDRDDAADEITSSQLYQNGDSFFVYQSIYGTNVMMLMSSAVYESSYGRSRDAFLSNRLYFNAAYDSEPERESDRYNSIDASIRCHAKHYVSTLFSSHLKSFYSGTCFGNKLFGINVNYSYDPYYGEKCASIYYGIDKALEQKDRNHYAIGIMKDRQKVSFYRDEDLDEVLYSLRNVEALSFAVLEEMENCYKIQIDDSFDEDRLYDFERSVAYVAKDSIDYVLNRDSIHEDAFATIIYDFGEGSFIGRHSLDLKLRENDSIPEIRPYREGYEFCGYDEQMQAQYRRIEKIEVAGDKNGVFELYRDIDLADFSLLITYEDGDELLIPLNTDMIPAYDNTLPGKQELTVTYNGVETTWEIEFSEELSDLRDRIMSGIEAEDYTLLKKQIGSIDLDLSFSQIRKIDQTLRERNRRNYVIQDQTESYDLSFSGLDLSLPDRKSFHLVKDTYYVTVNEIASEDEKRILQIAQGYGFEKVAGIDISFRFNYQDIEPQGPVIVQLNPIDKQDQTIYSVYHVNRGGEVIKCRTTQTENYIQFLISGSGPYEILKMPGVNRYGFEDTAEDLTYENMGYDNHRINMDMLMVLILSISGVIAIVIYYIFDNMDKKQWKDYRRLLQEAESVPEEKPKN